jgi:hypothetical protein
MQIDVIGAYPVEAPESCHLVEIIVREHRGPIDVGSFTQHISGRPQDSWQVPWDERILDANGNKQLLERFPRDIIADGPLRLAFFFHYLRFDRPLITPAGEVALPPPTKRPDRLAFIEYESPC